MELTAAEGRVLGCLIDRQAASPEAYALSLDEVRFACNHSGSRPDAPVFDDRTVDDALVSLKSKGLARFVQAGRNVGPVRYRHRADERWRLSPAELAVLAALLLGGPQTVDEVRVAVQGTPNLDSPEDVETALDALAGRTPTPFATRVPPAAWGGETLWAEILTGPPSSEELYQAHERREPPVRLQRPSVPPPAAAPAEPADTTPTPASSNASSLRPTTLAELADRLTNIERRLAAIETALGALRSNAVVSGQEAGRAPSHRGGQESSRMIR